MQRGSEQVCTEFQTAVKLALETVALVADLAPRRCRQVVRHGAAHPVFRSAGWRHCLQQHAARDMRPPMHTTVTNTSCFKIHLRSVEMPAAHQTCPPARAAATCWRPVASPSSARQCLRQPAAHCSAECASIASWMPSLQGTCMQAARLVTELATSYGAG